jgi:protein gp37
MSTKIEWTDETWNPVTGCTKVSQGCKNCYAERLAPKVFAGQMIRDHYREIEPALPPRPRVFTDVITHPDRLEAPLHWRRPRRVFVNSMSDLFHEDVPDKFIDKVWEVMINALDQGHIFQVLTKRPQRMKQYLSVKRWPRCGGLDQHPIENVWLGVSVEDQVTADERIPLLQQTAAAIRFVSYEPALGPVDFTAIPRIDPEHPHPPYYDLADIDWLIAGGESGPKARPAHPDWFRSARDQCAAAGVAFFFKQWGAHAIGELKPGDPILRWQTGATQWYGDAADIKLQDFCIAGDRENGYVFAVPERKPKAGRLLDGREHNEYPEAHS